MKLPAIIALAFALSGVVSAPVQAGSRVEKVYGENGRRVAVIKTGTFGQKVYGQNGRRIATIRR